MIISHIFSKYKFYLQNVKHIHIFNTKQQTIVKKNKQQKQYKYEMMHLHLSCKTLIRLSALTRFNPADKISFVDAFLHRTVSFEYDFFSVHGINASSPSFTMDLWSPVWYDILFFFLVHIHHIKSSKNKQNAEVKKVVEKINLHQKQQQKTKNSKPNKMVKIKSEIKTRKLIRTSMEQCTNVHCQYLYEKIILKLLLLN